MIMLKIFSSVGAFFVVFLMAAIGLESAGGSPGAAGTLGLVAAVVTWFIVPTKQDRTEAAPVQTPTQPEVVVAPKPHAVEPAAIPSTVEVTDAHWALALKEYEHGQRNDGLFARLFTECEGDETRIKAAYLKERAKAIAAGESQDSEMSAKKKP